MIFKQSFLKFVALSAALSLGIGVGPLVSRPLRAEMNQVSLDQNSQLSQYLNTNFNVPSRGAPPRTKGGGSRGCGYEQSGEKTTTALIPTDHIALTAQGNPTFFWYVPESVAEELEFKLLDKDDQEVVYETKLPVPTQSGIVSVSLPSDGESQFLEAGQKYHWYLVMACDLQDRTGDVAIEGWIERVDPASKFVAPDATLADSLLGASLPERFSLYAKAGIWHDALATLGELRRSQPNNALIEARWARLLATAGLDQFSQAEFIPNRKSVPTARLAL